MNRNSKKAENKDKIDNTGIAKDLMTSRAGLTLFSRYLDKLGIWEPVVRLFGGIRKNRKGASAQEIFKQAFMFFADGTSRHLAYFDELQKDLGYAAAIETAAGRLISSHGMKRAFRAFGPIRVFKFRELLQKLFVWRLNIDNPLVIELFLDTMVMDNDDAEHRGGVSPTYKNVKGFQPLQLIWNGFVIDAVFRGGRRHSNYSDHVEKMLRHVVAQIRKGHRADVPIIVRSDSGFFDQKLFELCRSLGIGFSTSGKMYEDIKTFGASCPPESWTAYSNGASDWEYAEFGNRRASWKIGHHRAFYLRLAREETGQGILEFARPDTVVYTNLGMGQAVDSLLRAAGQDGLMAPEEVIRLHHLKGKGELAHRGFKEFRDERMPFKQFLANAAFYYMALTSFFLFEAFKIDVAVPVVLPGAYPNTVRRKLVDIAGKIVRHGGKTILKVAQSVWDGLGWAELWRRSGTPPLFVWAR